MVVWFAQHAFYLLRVIAPAFFLGTSLFSMSSKLSQSECSPIRLDTCPWNQVLEQRDKLEKGGICFLWVLPGCPRGSCPQSLPVPLCFLSILQLPSDTVGSQLLFHISLTWVHKELQLKRVSCGVKPGRQSPKRGMGRQRLFTSAYRCISIL